MIETQWLLWGALLPLLVSFAAVFVWRQPWRPASSPASNALGWIVPLVDGYAIGALVYLAVKQPLPFPPVESTHYLAMVVLPMVAACEIIGVVPRVPRLVHWMLRALVILATPPLLLLPFIHNQWTTGEAMKWCGGLSLGLAMVWGLLDLLAARSDRRSPWLAVGVAAAGTGVTLLASGSSVLGQLGLTLAVSLAGVWLAMVVIGGGAALRGGLGVAVVLLAGLLINGYFYAALHPVHALLLAAAPLAAWVAHLPPLRRGRPWMAAVVVAVLAGAIVAAAAVPAAIKAQKEASESGY